MLCDEALTTCRRATTSVEISPIPETAMTKNTVRTRPTGAAKLLGKWIEDDPSCLSLEENIERYKVLSTLVDNEFDQCQNESDKLAVLNVHEASVQALNAGIGIQSKATKELHSALANRSIGLRGGDVLDRPSPASQRLSVEDAFNRARVMVALEKCPANESIILNNAAKQQNLTPEQIRKSNDNYNRGRIPSRALERNIEDLRERFDAGEMELFDDLLK